MTKIARGSRKTAPTRGKAPSRGKASSKKGGAAAAPLPEAVKRVSGWILVGMLAALAVAALAAFRVPQLLAGTLGQSVGQAGFALKHVEIRGANRVPQLEVYNIAFDQPNTSMPLIDLEGTRQRLLQFGWVREARVSRRYPDTLVVDIVERRPAAIWQHNQRLSLIDREGTVLEAVKLEAMPDLPLVIGPAANLHAGELARLVDTAPQLKPMMAGASWIGGRRWDIRFQSGEVLALPEGEEAAKRAIAHFARMDEATQLLSRGFVRFDMRIPGKFIVRVSREPGSAVPSIAPDVDPQTMPAPAAPPPHSRPVTGDAPVSKTI